MKLKLHTLLKLMDTLTDVRIFSTDEDEPLFDGVVLDIPYYLIDLPLAKPEGDWEGIRVGDNKLIIVVEA